MHNLLLHVLDLMKRGGALALGVIIGCLIAILILRLITRKKAENFPWKRLAPGALTAGYLALVAMGTLLRMSGEMMDFICDLTKFNFNSYHKKSRR